MAEPAIVTGTVPTPTPTPVPAATPVVPVSTELGGAPAVEPAKVDANGVSPVLGPDGQPIPPKIEDKKPEPQAVAFDPAKLQLPQGMKSDDPLFQEFTGALADDKLDPQARGQKLLSVYEKGVNAIKEANTKAWNDTNEAWVNQVKADPEIGGAKFAETKTTIARAIDSLGPELSVAFRQGLDATGAGNHPAIWKGLAKLAALVTEGGHVSGNPPSSAKPTIKEAFYPNSPDMK